MYCTVLCCTILWAGGLAGWQARGRAGVRPGWPGLCSSSSSSSSAGGSCGGGSSGGGSRSSSSR
eukprot:8844082-Heterocapsa_arctica.AAC.1